MDGVTPDSWEKLQRCFPELLKSPHTAALTKDVLKRNLRDESLRWTLLARALEDAVLAEENCLIPLGTSMPGLWAAGGLGVTQAPNPACMPPVWSQRALNRLRLNGYLRWVDLAAATPLDLAEMRAAGVKTVSEIVGHALTLAWLMDGSAAEESSGSPVSEHGPREAILCRPTGFAHAFARQWSEADERAMRVSSSLDVLSAWAWTEMGARTLGELSRLASGSHEAWPLDVQQAAELLAAESLAEPAPGSNPLDAINDWCEALDDRGRAIFSQRLFACGTKTPLDEIARSHGVTRERIRQLEGQIRAQFAEWLEGDEARSVRWRTRSLREYAGLWCPLDQRLVGLLGYVATEAEGWGESVSSGVLLTLAGPYRLTEGILAREGYALPDISQAASDTGLVDLEAYRDLLRRSGILDRWLGAAIEVQRPSLRRMGAGLYVWTGGLASKVIAALDALGEPASASQIAEAIDPAIRTNQIGNVLRGDARTMRSGKGLWALSAWGLEEYSGIAEEIRERLEAAAGGPLNLRALADELVDKFGVSEASVRAYADAPAFVVSDGEVRLRQEDDVYPPFTDLSRVRGTYVDGTAFITHLTLDAGIIRNGSCYVHRLVAGRLGVRPGQRSTYRWAGEQVQVHWPLTSASGPIVTGLRPVFEKHSAAPGDVLRLRFDLASGELVSRRIEEPRPSADPLSKLQELTGLQLLPQHDIEEQVAAAIEVPTPRVRAVLRDRGDDMVAASIPFNTDVAVKDDALAALFGDLARDLDLG